MYRLVRLVSAPASGASRHRKSVWPAKYTALHQAFLTFCAGRAFGILLPGEAGFLRSGALYRRADGGLARIQILVGRRLHGRRAVPAPLLFHAFGLQALLPGLMALSEAVGFPALSNGGP